MNPLAKELNQVIEAANPHMYNMLSAVGKNLFFPKGLLSQSAEAKEKAYKLNATIGIATENGQTMYLPSIMASIDGISPENALTYAPSFGIPELRRAWQNELLEKNLSITDKTNISLPVVTGGITHAVSVFADVWVDPADVVILPDMMWGNYNLIFTVRKGAQIEQYTLFNENGGFNLAAFEKKIEEIAQKKNKIIVLLNFPHNPSGYTITQTESAKITAILTGLAQRGKDVIAVMDDSYFGLFYEKNVLKESMFALLAGQHERLMAVKLDGATKENFVWGLRVGFITYGCKCNGHAENTYIALEKKTAGCVRGSISNVSRLSQAILLKSFQHPNYQAEKAAKYRVLESRARCVKRVLSDPKYQDFWEMYPFNSGYFMCIRLKTVNAETLRRHLLDTYGIGLIALAENNLRIAFSCLDEKEIPQLFDMIVKGIEDLTTK
jgi:aspartate/methionine/tyrosine aminotransferase